MKLLSDLHTHKMCIRDRLNIFSIYIEDNYSQSEIEDIIKPELRNKATSIIKDTFNRCV